MSLLCAFISHVKQLSLSLDLNSKWLSSTVRDGKFQISGFTEWSQFWWKVDRTSSPRSTAARERQMHKNHESPQLRLKQDLAAVEFLEIKLAKNPLLRRAVNAGAFTWQQQCILQLKIHQSQPNIYTLFWRFCFLDATADRRIKTRKNWVPASSDEDLVMRSKRQNKV